MLSLSKHSLPQEEEALRQAQRAFDAGMNASEAGMPAPEAGMLSLSKHSLPQEEEALRQAQRAFDAGMRASDTGMPAPEAGMLSLSKHSLPQEEEALRQAQRAFDAGMRAFENDLPNQWELKLCAPNALTLDHAALQIEQGAWSQPLYILDAHQKVAAAGVGTSFALRYTFEASEIPPGEVFLAVEAPERFAISINGQAVSCHASANPSNDWWVDISFRKVPLTGRLQKGVNEIVLRGVFEKGTGSKHDTELESVYLVGWFGVRLEAGQFDGGSSGQVFYRYPPRFTVAGLASTVAAQDLVNEGLPFFAGRVRLAQTVNIPLKNPAEKPAIARLALDNPRLAVARVLVNGQDCGLTAWPPYEVDVSAALQPGDNRIELELVNTLRNLCGPHHVKGGEGEAVGPHSFRLTPQWTDDYVFVPFGLGGARLIVS